MRVILSDLDEKVRTLTNGVSLLEVIRVSDLSETELEELEVLSNPSELVQMGECETDSLLVLLAGIIMHYNLPRQFWNLRKIGRYYNQLRSVTNLSPIV